MHALDDQNNKNQHAYTTNGLPQHRIPTQHIKISSSSPNYLIYATFNSTLIQHFIFVGNFTRHKLYNYYNH